MFFQTGGMVLALWSRETFSGGYSGVFIDPDGHPWEVAHDPFWQLGTDGAVRI